MDNGPRTLLVDSGRIARTAPGVLRAVTAIVSCALLILCGPSFVATISAPTPFEHEHHSETPTTASGQYETLSEPRPRFHREMTVAPLGVFSVARLSATHLSSGAFRVLGLHSMRDLRNGIGAPLLT